MKRTYLCLFLLMACILAWCQPRYDYLKLRMEQLDRGVVAVRQADNKVFISWRILRDDRKGEAFDVYRNGVKLNAEPLTRGGSFFIDENPLSGSDDVVYEVRGGCTNGQFTLCSDAPEGYLSLKLDKPEGGIVPKLQTPVVPNNNWSRRRGGWRDDGSYVYTANDASVADVDGDGQLEILLKWEPSNARDNAHDGYTGSTVFDCYRLNGERLWRINMGRNIRSGAHYVPFLFYDFDGDGKAELMVKAADGTCDGQGHVLGDSTVDYRSPQGRILDGPEYIAVFNGQTGAVMDVKPYVPERGDLAAWGDTKGNRSERYLAAVAYLDGQKASGVFCRGYYTRSVLAAWEWDGQRLRERWVFDTNNPQWRDYAGQGNHNLRVADVDGDGCDEITYGAMAVDHDGTGLYNTRMGHGDALHLTAFDPTTDRLQVWDCHENRRDGSEFRDAATGKVIFQIKSKDDVGRAMAADIDPTNPGVEMWSTDSHGVRNLKGEVVCQAKDADDPQHSNQLVLKGRRLSVNFGIWWDGDLLRELLDHETVSKYDWEERTVVDVMKFEGCQFNNGTKSNPSLSADLLGDWREEVLVRNRESTELRIYTTTIPTPYRVNCLLQDVPYRLSVANENVGYNQPPETGFYLGPDRTDYLK